MFAVKKRVFYGFFTGKIQLFEQLPIVPNLEKLVLLARYSNRLMIH